MLNKEPLRKFKAMSLKYDLKGNVEIDSKWLFQSLFFFLSHRHKIKLKLEGDNSKWN